MRRTDWRIMVITIRNTHSEICQPEEEGEEGNHNEENRLKEHRNQVVEPLPLEHNLHLQVKAYI